MVISIISLLSSVILGSMNQARVKAKNATRNQMVIQERNALELYRSSNNAYPNTYSASPNYYYCLGIHPNDVCGTYQIDSSIYYGIWSNLLNNAIATYLSGAAPISTSPVPLFGAPEGNTPFLGALYRCNNASCSNPTVSWALEGTNQRCAQGAAASNLGSATFCVLSL